MSKVIKVLHISKNMGMGGVEQFIMNQFRVLSKMNVVFDFCIYGKQEDVFEEEIRRLGGRLIKHPLPNDNINTFKKKFIRTLREGNYDAVHSHQNFFSGIILPLAKKEGVKVRIAHAHTTQDMKSGNLIRPLYRRIMRRRILKSATHLLAPSCDASLFLFGENIVREKNTIIFPNAIDTEYFLYAQKEYRLRETFNISEKSYLLGHVGTFKPSKNHLFLLEIFSKYKEKYNDGHLILVGDGEKKLEVMNKVKELKLAPFVHFINKTTDIAPIFSELDIFLFPSLYEGLGMTVIEAQACGIPSVITENIPEEVDLKIGLVERASLENLEEWVGKIKSSLQKGKSTNTDERRKILEEYGYDSIKSANKLLTIYRNEDLP